jgi:hypothetical protein
MTQPLMTLTARFDVNQIDDGVDWVFADLDCKVDPSVKTLSRLV